MRIAVSAKVVFPEMSKLQVKIPISMTKFDEVVCVCVCFYFQRTSHLISRCE